MLNSNCEQEIDFGVVSSFIYLGIVFFSKKVKYVIVGHFLQSASGIWMYGVDNFKHMQLFYCLLLY